MFLKNLDQHPSDIVKPFFIILAGKVQPELLFTTLFLPLIKSDDGESDVLARAEKKMQLLVHVYFISFYLL